MLFGLPQRLRFRRLKELYSKHERFVIPLMLLVGVVVDVVTFRTIDPMTAFLLLGAYALIAGAGIVFIHGYDAQAGILDRPSFTGYLRVVSPLLVQLTFGALLSAALIFYWFSGSFGVSWPILIIVVALMTGNDVFREHYLRPAVQLAVYYFIVFTTLAVALPSLLGSIAPWIFFASGVASVCLFVLYLQALYRFRPDLKLIRPSPMMSMIVIFLVMNSAYLFNVIPPIPLSLTEVGVYQSVERQGSGYVLEGYDQTFLDRFLPNEHIEVEPGERVYVYASIFAPVDLNTTIVHDWQYLTQEGWESRSRLTYTIVGGRTEGYRGYSYITSHQPGKWRVDVKTPRGQVIGRIQFYIRSASSMSRS